MNATLLKHITSYEREDPEFVNQMLRLLYVDNLSVSLEDVDKAYQLYLKSRERMTQGGFNLHKMADQLKSPNGEDQRNGISEGTQYPNRKGETAH